MVETAIIMPVFVFLILGLLQLGLMHHARVMAKYAAYKAVRAGSLNRGEREVMEKAALAVLVPVLGRNTPSGAPSKTDSAGAYNSGWNILKNNQQDNVDFVDVVVCNPQRSQVTSTSNFDDPRDALGQGRGGTTPPDPDDPGGGGGGGLPGLPGFGGGATAPPQDFGWQQFNATKLQIQLTVFYRMYIPFANWMVFRLAVGEETGSPKKMRWLGWKKDPNDPKSETIKRRLLSMADSRKYVMPIRTSYAMRMQSNFSEDAASNLPNAGGRGTNTCGDTGKFGNGPCNDDNKCRIPWKKM